MTTVGIDMGIENIKIVVLQDGKIIGRGKGRSGGAKRLEAAKAVYESALKEAGLTEDQVEKVFVTGKGKYDLESIADDIITEPVTAAKAAEFLCPGVTCVFSIGADETMALTLDQDARIIEMVINEKCAAGVGSFIRNMARRLEFTQEEMSAVPPKAPDDPSISDGCIVFAELDALNLMNRDVPPEKIASAVIFTAVIRASTVIKDLTEQNYEKAVLLGGLTQNKAFVNQLQAWLELEFVIPEEAEYAPALGAALLAADWGVNPFDFRKREIIPWEVLHAKEQQEREIGMQERT